MSEQVISEIAEGVQTIRIERMDAENRLTAEMCERLADSLAFGESSSRVRAVLLTGTPGMFTTGHDVNDLQGFLTAGGMGESVIRLLKTIASIDKPVIAAVDGPSFSLGTILLILCDYVVASEWSIFSAASAEIGMPPEGAASILAPALMGYHRAFGLLVMGDQFDAQQAMNAGLVNRIVPADAVETAGQEAARILAEKPPEAVRMHRRLMRGDRLNILQRIDLEATSFADLLRSPAARDALQAYIDANR
jgi:enoyl-CoA hydratase/carnithine racemase